MAVTVGARSGEAGSGLLVVGEEVICGMLFLETIKGDVNWN
jgi:hypothetical protein